LLLSKEMLDFGLEKTTGSWNPAPFFRESGSPTHGMGVGIKIGRLWAEKVVWCLRRMLDGGEWKCKSFLSKLSSSVTSWSLPPPPPFPFFLCFPFRLFGFLWAKKRLSFHFRKACEGVMVVVGNVLKEEVESDWEWFGDELLFGKLSLGFGLRKSLPVLWLHYLPPTPGLSLIPPSSFSKVSPG